MARESLSFDNWTLGDTGRHGPMAYHYGRRKMLASYGHFRGVNVMRYPNGAVGPRPALCKLLPAHWNVTVNGTVKWALFAQGVYYLVTHTGYVYIKPGDGATAWITVNTGVTPLVATTYQRDIYIGAVGGVYRITNAGVQSGPFAGSPASCQFLTEYREFLVGATSGSSAISYTNPGDGTTWPAANRITIGDGKLIITGLLTHRNSLATAIAGGEWWTTTGFLGADGSAGNDITRRADVGLEFPGIGASVMQSSIWYLNGRDACSFTGAQTSVEPLPDPPSGSPIARFPTFNGESGAPLTYTGLVPTFNAADSFLAVGTETTGGVQANYGFLRSGAQGWSRHTFPLNTTTPTQPLLVQSSAGYVFAVAQVGTTASWYLWSPRQEIPYGVGASPAGYTLNDIFDYDGDSGGVVAGSFSLPEWWIPDGGGISVAGVVVDFDYDAEAVVRAVTAGSSPDGLVDFDVSVDALNISNDDGNRSSKKLPLILPPEALTRTASATGVNMVRRRSIFRVGDQGMGTGFRVNLTNMRGVQVYRIVVVADIDESRVF